MQIWCSNGSHSSRPTAGDVLVGSVYVRLADLLTSQGNLRYACRPFRALGVGLSGPLG